MCVSHLGLSLCIVVNMHVGICKYRSKKVPGHRALAAEVNM